MIIDEFSAENLLENPSLALQNKRLDWLIIGDMCYEEELARSIVQLILTARRSRIDVLLADPGRFAFQSVVRHQLVETMRQVGDYPIIDRDYIEPEFQMIGVWRT